MQRTAAVKLGLFLALGSVFAMGCGSSSTSEPDAGTGGAGGRAGSGGGTASGGSTGSGGGTATGGRVGTGGSAGSGGSAGAGGSVNTGGTAGTGNGGAAGGAGRGGSGGSVGGAGGSVGGAGGRAGGAGGGVAGAAGGSAGHAGAGGVAGAAGGSAGSAGGAAGGSAGSAGAAGSAGGAAGGMGGANPVVARGEYLVKNVLGCVGCHTPSGGASLSGSDCFVNSGGSCLSSANLTNDATGLRDLTDQQIKDAIMLGKDPKTAGKYLFSNMPYYQFANLNSADATAIVAFLRSVPGVAHQVAANTAPYDVRPVAPQNAPVDPTYLPGTTSSNGKYLATLACVTCHTVDVPSSTPKIIDSARAFQGGKIVNATVNGTARMVQTGNLTPHSTGIAGWTAAQVATAITMAKDRNGVAICGMRALANMTTADATDIGTYLLSIPPAINALTMTCQ